MLQQFGYEYHLLYSNMLGIDFIFFATACFSLTLCILWPPETKDSMFLNNTQ